MSRSSNSLAILAIAVGVMGVVALVFLLQFRSISANAQRIAEDMNASVNKGRPAAPRHDPSPSPRMVRSLRSSARLRDRLEERTELYRNQLDQLARKSKEHDKLATDYQALAEKYQALQRDYDQLWNDADASLNSVVEALQEDIADGNSIDVIDEVETELSLQEHAVLEDLQLNLEMTSFELEKANLRISELTAGLASESQVSMALSSALIDLGAPATPLVIPMLSDQRPEIRAWAAWILGHIRPAEAETKSALTALALDSNADVANAARVALENIEKSQ